jgi:hypothetical protein
MSVLRNGVADVFFLSPHTAQTQRTAQTPHTAKTPHNSISSKQKTVRKVLPKGRTMRTDKLFTKARNKKNV